MSPYRPVENLNISNAHDNPERRKKGRRGNKADGSFWRAMGSNRRDVARTAKSLDVELPLENPADDPAHPTTASAENPADLRELNATHDLPDSAIAERRDALKSMLAASSARFEQATRNRRPTLAPGVEVRVISGPRVGEHAVILDADYIEERVLLSFPDQPSPEWINFSQVGAPRTAQ